MVQPIVYIDASRIRRGKLEELEKAINRLAKFVETNVPQLISYSFYFNEDHTQMTVVALHPDSDSLKRHLDAGGEEFKKFADLIDLVKIEIYGDISEAVLERLNQKADSLGKGAVIVHDFVSGFTR